MRKNTDTPFGFIPYGGSQKIGAYRKDASASALYPGDALIMEADGNIAIADTNSTNIIGVAASYSANTTADEQFLVYDDPHQLFMVQDDSAGTGLTSASVGLNTRIVATAGSTTTLRSLQEIDSGQATTTTAALPVRIVGLHPIEARTFGTTTGQQKKWIVQFNKHARAQGEGKVGL